MNHADDFELIPLCSAQDATDFGALRVEVAGFEPLAIFHADGEFYVTDDTCTHGAASLSEGMVEEGRVGCPWHSGSFCLKTGAALSFPATTPIRTYPVILDGGQVCIRAQKEESEQA